MQPYSPPPRRGGCAIKKKAAKHSLARADGAVAKFKNNWSDSRASADKPSRRVSLRLSRHVLLEEGKPKEAESAMRELLQRTKNNDQSDIRGNREAATVLLARALLAQGKAKDAANVYAEAEAIFGKRLRLQAMLREVVRARIQAANGQAAEAVQLLNKMLTEAKKIGYVEPQFEARLALGEIEIQSGKVASGRSQLSALAKEAAAKGFTLTARKASTVRG